MQFISGYWWKKGKKEKNEDSIALCQLVVQKKRCMLAAVCDGIGGLQYGEKASGFVTEALIQWFYEDVVRMVYKRRRKRSFLHAGQRLLFSLHLKMQEYDQTASMGTTASILLFVGRQYYWWHAGDSRIYRKRKRGGMKLLTRDDWNQGRLLNGIGSFPWKGIQGRSGSLSRGDGFLICSDGFYNRLPEKILELVVSPAYKQSQQQIEGMLEEVVEKLEKAGERDDISAIYIKAE